MSLQTATGVMPLNGTMEDANGAQSHDPVLPRANEEDNEEASR